MTTSTQSTTGTKRAASSLKSKEYTNDSQSPVSISKRLRSASGTAQLFLDTQALDHIRKVKQSGSSTSGTKSPPVKRRAQTMSTPRKMDASLVPSLESVFFVPNNPPSSNGTPFVPPSTDSANTTISLDNEADESAEINPFSVDNQLLFQNLFLNATPFWNFDLPALQQQPFDCFGFPIVFSDLDKVATPEFDDSSDDCFDEFLVFSSPDRAQAFDMYTVNGNQTDFVNSDATPHLMSILTRTELKQRECVEINEVKDSDEEDEIELLPHDADVIEKAVAASRVENLEEDENSDLSMRPVACASKISHNLEINPCTPPITAPGTRNVSPVDFSESPEDLPLQYIPEPECPGEYIDPDLKKELLEQHSRTIKAAVAAIAAAELASQSRGKTVKQKAVSKPLQPKKTGSPQIVPKPPAKVKESSGDRRSSLRFQTPVDSEEDIIQQENVNTSTQSIKCLICHKPYGSKNGLKYHMNKQHAS